MTDVSNGTHRKARSIVLWPSLFTLGLLLTIGIIGAIDPVLLVFAAGLPLTVITILTVAVCIWMTCVEVSRRRFSRAASYAILPVAVLAAFLAPFSILSPFARLGARLRFELNRSSYEAEIARSPHPVGKRVAVFDWSGFAGNNNFLIYDESDALAREEVPENLQFMGRCAYRSARYIGHYYFCND